MMPPLSQATFLSGFSQDEVITPRGVTLSAPATRRLSKQCAAIHERLQKGPATNSELARMALSYTRRLSDLREAGYAVDCYKKDEETGLNWYRLTP